MRPGSVLILVVAVLVLLTLMGTAWLSMARTSQFTATSDNFNTQAQQTLDGVAELVNNLIIADVLIPGELTASWINAQPTVTELEDRKANFKKDPGVGSEYSGVDDHLVDSLNTNRWLAARLPVKHDRFDDRPPYVWPTVSRPVFVDDGTTRADTVPDILTGDEFSYISDNFYPFRPTFFRSAQGNIYPALYSEMFRFPRKSPSQRRENPVVPAADADGDGIADAILVRAPLPPINGVELLVGIRVVDNSAAININTALASSFDLNFGHVASTGEIVDGQGVFRVFDHAGEARLDRGPDVFPLGGRPGRDTWPRQIRCG